jgi:hypothetical protein
MPFILMITFKKLLTIMDGVANPLLEISIIRRTTILIIIFLIFHHENAPIYRLWEAQPPWLYFGLVEDMTPSVVLSPLDAA